MHISKYLDVNKLVEHIANGKVTEKKHPNLPLSILTYSREAVWEDLWDDVTTKCRGLIVSDEGDIIARPFEKFFNFSTTYRPETWLSNLPKSPPIVAEKLDGSLGIFYNYQGKVGVASKGSFISDHALWATGWYNKNIKNPRWPGGYTPVFEMICQSVQHHVVHYEGEDRLVLLALVDNETGEELPYDDLFYWSEVNGISVAGLYYKNLGTVLDEDRPNTEGYVLSWPRNGQTPLKVKVKHETFLKLQKLVHAATPKAILEALAEGNLDLVYTWENQSSPELAAFVHTYSTEFMGSFGNIMVNASNLVNNARLRFTDRKDVAEFFNTKENQFYSAICFAMYDGKDYKPAIWKRVAGRFRDEDLNKPLVDVDDDDGDKE